MAWPVASSAWRSSANCTPSALSPGTGVPRVTCSQSSGGGAVRRPSTASETASGAMRDPHVPAHRQALLEAEHGEIDHPRERAGHVGAAGLPVRR